MTWKRGFEGATGISSRIAVSDTKTSWRTGSMSRSRRDFLAHTSLGLLGAAVGCRKGGEKQVGSGGALPPGAPSAFATAPAVGPKVSADTFAEAEKLVQVELSGAERAQAAETWRVAMAPLYERRTGPRKVALEATLAPATTWTPVIPQGNPGAERDVFVRTANDPGKLPEDDREIAFAPVTKLSRWLETKQITSERLTKIYLERLEKFNGTLRCVITLTRDLAMEQARRADREIAARQYRGPLHGVPWGAKDLLDTAGVGTRAGGELLGDADP